MATPSYKERMAAARAAARAQREAEKAEWHRRAELRYEIRKLALDAVKAGIKARGDKFSLYSHAQLVAAGKRHDRPLAREPGSLNEIPKLCTQAW